MKKLHAVISRYVFDLLAFIGGTPLIPVFLRWRYFSLLGVRFQGASRLSQGVLFHGNSISFGPLCVVSPGVFFDASAPIDIGERVHIASMVRILSVTHTIMPSVYRRDTTEFVAAGVTIGRGVWIGGGAIILPGARIGEGCVIGAGAVVRGVCEPNGMYAGVPARRIRDLPLGVATLE